jgi:hypothetical protein
VEQPGQLVQALDLAQYIPAGMGISKLIFQPGHIFDIGHGPSSLVL